MHALYKMISMMSLSSLAFHSSDAGQVCASCSDIARPKECTRHIECEDDENCYIRRYVNESGISLYEMGCSSPQICYHSNQPIIGKRAEGQHFKCISCCNDTRLCNQFSDCIVPAPDGPAVCASCRRISRPADCQNKVQCDKDEKCYLHKYSTNTGSMFYDLGCIVSQICPSYPTEAEVSRREVHHLKCMTCCENDMCNRNLACGEPLINQSTTTTQATTSWALTTSTVTLKPKDCSEVSYRRNGSYRIYPYGFSVVGASVYCEFNSDGAWTVIQRRIDNSVNFDRNWTDYKTGFGDVLGNYWLGNDAIHYITAQGNYSLKIILTDWSDITKYALYNTFRVADEIHRYNLTVTGYSGNAGDSFGYNNGHQFTTFDIDNDSAPNANCAATYTGGWWYNNCNKAYLNGNYFPSLISTSSNYTGIFYFTWPGYSASLKATTMMINRIK